MYCNIFIAFSDNIPLLISIFHFLKQYLKKPNGESALYLKNAKTEEELMIDITFYVPKGKSAFEVI